MLHLGQTMLHRKAKGGLSQHNLQDVHQPLRKFRRRQDEEGEHQCRQKPVDAENLLDIETCLTLSEETHLDFLLRHLIKGRCQRNHRVLHIPAVQALGLVSSITEAGGQLEAFTVYELHVHDQTLAVEGEAVQAVVVVEDGVDVQTARDATRLLVQNDDIRVLFQGNRDGISHAEIWHNDVTGSGFLELLVGNPGGLRHAHRGLIHPLHDHVELGHETRGGDINVRHQPEFDPKLHSHDAAQPVG
mmetsp:Transcript_3751/g.9040  ORF Transcript_3751/g.9040 Transcript_3751/m.9040 type:complete len:245 (-) Transcript_3751:3215-3949(-)